MLKIERTANGEVVFKLTGRMGADNVNELENLIKAEASCRRVVLDLKDLRLVDQEVVSFLRRCEATASSSRIVRHTSASGSRENGDEQRNQNSN